MPQRSTPLVPAFEGGYDLHLRKKVSHNPLPPPSFGVGETKHKQAQLISQGIKERRLVG